MKIPGCCNDPFDKAWPNKTFQYAAGNFNLFHSCKTGIGIRVLTQNFAPLYFVFKSENWVWSS